MSTEIPHRAWVEIRESALRRNLRTVRETAGPGVRLIPMVKADAYGLGVAEVVEVLDEADPWGYGVATVEEGVELRGLGVGRPILVVSPVPPGAEGAAVAAGLTLCVSDIDALRRLSVAAEQTDSVAAVHLEVDTGMGRAGFPAATVGQWYEAVGAMLGGPLRLEGVFTHYHSADGSPEVAHSSMREQRRRFDESCARLGTRFGEDLFRHLANSAAVFREPGGSDGAVRPGIFLYGGGVGEGLPRPDPVVSVRARVVRVVDVPEGATQGYGATHRARKPERWATLGIGYGDGLPRLLSNRGRALVGGEAVPIVGRISMDVTVVDITGVPNVESGEIATLVGSDRGREIALDHVAAEARTISYEILTGLSRRLPRVWIRD